MRKTRIPGNGNIFEFSDFAQNLAAMIFSGRCLDGLPLCPEERSGQTAVVLVLLPVGEDVLIGGVAHHVGGEQVCGEGEGGEGGEEEGEKEGGEAEARLQARPAPRHAWQLSLRQRRRQCSIKS